MLGNEFPGDIKQIGMERIQGVRRERETWREKTRAGEQEEVSKMERPK